MKTKQANKIRKKMRNITTKTKAPKGTTSRRIIPFMKRDAKINHKVCGMFRMIHSLEGVDVV
jgi:hypothetical protein